MQLQFFGAARTVTGSRHLLTVNGQKILLDCGMFQGRREESERLNRQLGFDPAEISAVVMSHAHIDHSGALPSLVKGGFKGTIHATLATADLLGAMLRDSAHIQESDVKFLNKHRARRGESAKAPSTPWPTRRRRSRGSANTPTTSRRRWRREWKSPTTTRGTSWDRRWCSSTSPRERRRRCSSSRATSGAPTADSAGSRDAARGRRAHHREHLRRPRARTDRGRRRSAGRAHQLGLREPGKLIIPAFAVGRTQELVYAISRLIRARRIPGCSVYVDSPLALNVTEIFARHPECYDDEIRAVLHDTGDPFGFHLLEYVRSVEESINSTTGPGRSSSSRRAGCSKRDGCSITSRTPSAIRATSCSSSDTRPSTRSGDAWSRAPAR